MAKDTIIWLALPKTVGKILGSTAQGLTSAYKTHLKLVVYAIHESRKGEINQKQVREILNSLENIILKGKKLLHHIPKSPKIYVEKNLSINSKNLSNPRRYDRKTRNFGTECLQIIEHLNQFINLSERILKNYEKQLQIIEENLLRYEKEKSKLPFVRNYLDSQTQNAIDYLKMFELEELKVVKNKAKEILKRYKKLMKI